MDMFGKKVKNAKEWKYDELPTPLTPQDYKNIVDGVLKDRLDKICSLNSEWIKIQSDKNGEWPLDIYEKKVDGSNISMILAMTILTDVDIEDLKRASFDADLNEKKKVLDDIIYHKVVLDIDENTHVAHSRYKTPFGITNREFVTLRTCQKSDDSYLIALQSINYEDVPFDKSYVRGVSNCGTFLSKINDKTVRVFTIDHVDPKGWIPSAVVNSYKKKAGERLKKMQEVYDKYRDCINLKGLIVW